MKIYPTKMIEVPDREECRKQILEWMDIESISYRRLSVMTGIAASNLHATINGSRPLGTLSIERIYKAMNR